MLGDLAGFSGWQLFFVITSYLGCISLAIQVMRADDLTRTLLLGLMFTTSLITAILVPLRSSLAFATIWTQFIVRGFVTAFTLRRIWILQRSGSYPGMEHDLVNQAGAVLIGVAWLLYFRFSKRVRKVFGRNL